MNQKSALPVSLLVLTFSARAFAEEEATTIYERGGIAGAGLAVAGKIGVGLGQPFGDFGAALVGEVEVGYLLPFLDRSLQLFVSAASGGSSAESKGTLTDSRLPGDEGTFTYEISRRELTLGFGLLYRVPMPWTSFRPHLALGGRAVFWKIDVTGEGGGEPFGENVEQGTDVGLHVALGGEIYVGPGGITVEVRIRYVPVDAFVLRDTNASSLELAAGYRIFF